MSPNQNTTKTQHVTDDVQLGVGDVIMQFELIGSRELAWCGA
jgi:hypothetical protein